MANPTMTPEEILLMLEKAAQQNGFDVKAFVEAYVKGEADRLEALIKGISGVEPKIIDALQAFVALFDDPATADNEAPDLVGKLKELVTGYPALSDQVNALTQAVKDQGAQLSDKIDAVSRVANDADVALQKAIDAVKAATEGLGLRVEAVEGRINTAADNAAAALSGVQTLSEDLRPRVASLEADREALHGALKAYVDRQSAAFRKGLSGQPVSDAPASRASPLRSGGAAPLS